MHSLTAHFRCLGYTGRRSVLHAFFGLRRAPETLSLRQQMERVRRPHLLHLNMIRIGFDALLFQNEREAAEREVDLAVHRIRQIYDQVQIGVARVQHFSVNVLDADGFEHISGDGEADDLCDRYSVDNDGLDLFLVLTYSGSTIGSSPGGGDCDKDGKGSGMVVAIESADPELTATVCAHEMGHFLGYDDHSGDPNNLMSLTGARGLTGSQGETFRSHCLITECAAFH